MSEQKFCISCGNSLSPDEKFCPKCGTPVAPDNSQPAAQNPAYAYAPLPGQNAAAMKKNNTRLYIVIGAAVVLLIFFILIIHACTAKPSIVGKWTEPNTGVTYVFDKDGSFSGSFASITTNSGKYTIKGDKLTLTYGGASQTVTYKVEKENGKTELNLNGVDFNKD